MVIILSQVKRIYSYEGSVELIILFFINLWGNVLYQAWNNNM